MNLGYFRVMLRIIGAVLFEFAVIAVARGGLTFTEQREFVSSHMYVMRHTDVVPYSLIAMMVLGFVIFASSFLIRIRASGTRTI